MLLYVGLWLHNKSHAQAWQSFIRDQVTSALEKRTLWAMAGISFLAIYRELFEVILFYETLWAQAGEARHDAVLAGIAAAILLLTLLTLLGWTILKYSARLPIRLFFTVTSVLLVVMAVVFVGMEWLRCRRPAGSRRRRWTSSRFRCSGGTRTCRGSLRRD